MINCLWQVNSYKCLLMLVLCTLLSGCYNKWPELDTFAKEINCRDNRTEIIRRAARYQAEVLFDEVSHSIQISKLAETLVIEFDKSNHITRVFAFEIKVQFFGLHRRQLAPSLVLDCQAKKKN